MFILSIALIYSISFRKVRSSDSWQSNLPSVVESAAATWEFLLQVCGELIYF